MIELNEGEMLADKFWLNPDSKMIWVKDNHIKTIVENPVLFECNGRSDLDRQLKNYMYLFGYDEVKYKSLDEFYEKVDKNIIKELRVFEHSFYQKGFVWCEFSEDILTVRTSKENFFWEALDDLREHLNTFKEVHYMQVLQDGQFIMKRLVGQNEIHNYMQERIFARKGKYLVEQPKEKKKFNIFKFINKLYA